MKQSQLYGQVFTYVLTIFLISFVLVYGYNSIQEFRKKAEQISCLKLRNDLKNAVDLIMGDFGSVKKKEIQLCSSYNELCFVETFEDFNRNNPMANIAVLDPLVEDSISSRTGKNVFLVGGESFYTGNISIDNDILCIQTNNTKISLRLE